MVVSTLKRWKSQTVGLNYATDWIVHWAVRQVQNVQGRPARLLDIGLGTARDLLLIREKSRDIPMELFGVEFQERHIENARQHGIVTFAVDIERERLPLDDGFLDVVMANHVIEHTKELFWIFGEFSRVLAPGGIGIIGCPNLGSWHNRVALLFGQQPPCMKVLGPHVRGITRPAFREFIQREGYFRLLASKGSNFYPFPIVWLNNMFARLMPGMCASIHFVFQRTEKKGSFLDVLDSGVPGMTDTPYYRGNGHCG